MKELAYGVFRLAKNIAPILQGVDTFFALLGAPTEPDPDALRASRIGSCRRPNGPSRFHFRPRAKRVKTMQLFCHAGVYDSIFAWVSVSPQPRGKKRCLRAHPLNRAPTRSSSF